MVLALQGHCCSLGMKGWRKVISILNVVIMTFKDTGPQSLVMS